MKLHSRLIIAVACTVATSGGLLAQDFSECGVLVLTQHCSIPLFQADSGLFLVDPAPVGFDVGDVVRVTGDRDPTCISICFQECIFNAVTVECDAPVGTEFCSPAIPNSTGNAGRLAAFGSEFVLANDLRLETRNLPAGEFGLFLASTSQGSTTPMGSMGVLCLAGNIGRYDGPTQIVQGPTGSLFVDLDSIPVNPPMAVQPGETWSFQCWYRDHNPGPTSNFTNAVSITFQ